ncbi:YfcC family protein [Virgibacillus halodenitrificans]|uniref:YfcC family protein n=1 Tax=Virgibacillus halodenitrificans TaxID=1482 RepID=UPI0002F79CDD|nr:TIGR00366 family protein [Virgibacillus halodenitrificans]MCG1027217.1 YfcC family protein [Virgibacillus halodenitrificans]
MNSEVAKKNQENLSNNQKRKKKWELPDAYVILFGILLIAAILTYFIPAGSFERETSESGASLVIPGSYAQIEQQPATVIEVFRAIQEGLIGGAGIIFLVLIIGGAFGVIESTGAIDTMIMKTINKTKNKEWLLITMVAILFSIFGGLGIIVNAVIAFIPIGIVLARAMKIDAIVGVAIIYLGAYSGFSIGFLDPATTGFAQQIAQLPLFSGLAYRLIIYVTILASSITYIVWYTNKVKKDPQKSILKENRFPKYDEKSMDNVSPNLTRTHILTLIVLVLGIGTYVFGVFQLGWSINEMAAIFIAIAIATAIVARIGANNMVLEFMKGCKGVVYGALIIGMARSIVVILENSMVLDTIVHGMSVVMGSFSSIAGAIALFIGNGIFNLIVSSGSGQAAIVMPIMTPLADIMEIPRQVAVQAYSMGDGFTNIITPLSGVLMANLAIAGIPWVKWIRFAIPLVLIWYAIGIIYLTIAVIINWGPM